MKADQAGHESKYLIGNDPLINEAVRINAKNCRHIDRLANACTGCTELSVCVKRWKIIENSENVPLTEQDLEKYKSSWQHPVIGCIVFALFWLNAHPETWPFIHGISRGL